jgi:putative PIN family toxin of toxin-antitoxin system
MMRCVVDTNVIVSASVFTRSVPRRAVERVLRNGVLLLSDFTMDELKDVLFREKFGRYVSRVERAIFLGHLGATAEFVPIVQLVSECRDPSDDKFLEVALNGRADVIVTGDKDLLEMHPRRGFAILSPSQYFS